MKSHFVVVKIIKYISNSNEFGGDTYNDFITVVCFVLLYYFIQLT